jgi:hypothetical protein
MSATWDGATRCDQCDNGINDGWIYCPFCGHPQAEEELAERDRLTKLQRLATPDPERVTGRIRKEDNGDRYFLGPLYCGQVAKVGGEWMVIALGQHTSTHPTEASARAALVAAVKEAIGDE